MKNNFISILACVCLVLASFLGGLYLGRNMRSTPIEVHVYTIPETSVQNTPVTSYAPPATQGNGKININTADLHTLMSLPGIGEVYAQRIIDYRNANGPFTDIVQIKNVEGIGEKRYEQIKYLITTGG